MSSMCRWSSPAKLLHAGSVLLVAPNFALTSPWKFNNSSIDASAPKSALKVALASSTSDAFVATALGGAFAALFSRASDACRWADVDGRSPFPWPRAFFPGAAAAQPPTTTVNAAHAARPHFQTFELRIIVLLIL
jgi:hypothetical protein